MKTGVYMFPTEYSIRPDELARAAEERGFESLWFPEHTHIPAERVSQRPGGPDLPREYWHTYDPFVAITAAAAATTKLILGTGICLVIERDPIVTALKPKQFSGQVNTIGNNSEPSGQATATSVYAVSRQSIFAEQRASAA